jgi:DNA polymerase-3 subunit gamma/tau
VCFEDADPRCQEITEGRSLDVLEIDGASNRGIEEIRELRETVKYAPATSTFKIYIIDEVHMLTKEAFNALLKTLEEPPEHVKFLFATTEPDKVLPTILSRCQRFDLRRIPVALIVKHLREIAEKESVHIDEAALYAIARGAEGALRDAESALDQLISFCGDKIVESDVLSMFGLTAQGQLLSLALGVLQGDAEHVLRELNDLAKHGKDLSRLLADLLNHFRNLLIYQISKSDWKLLEVSETEKENIIAQAGQISTDALTRIMEVLTECEAGLRAAASKKIFVEVALLRTIQARDAVSIDAVLQQLTQLRAKPSGSPAGSATNATAVSSLPEPIKTSQAVTSRPEPSASSARVEPLASLPGEEGLQQLWKSILEAVGRVSAFTRSYLVEAHPVALAKNVFTIGFDPEFADQMDLVNNPKTHTLLQTKLQELGYPNVQIKFIKAEAPMPVNSVIPAPSATVVAAPSAPAAARAAVAQPKANAAEKISLEDFKNDPLIQKALEIFKGQIVQVRA